MYELITISLIAIVVGAVIAFILYLYETVNQPVIVERAVVSSLTHTASTTVMMPVVTTPGVTFPYIIPESWNVNVDIDLFELDGMSISKEQYDSLTIGEEVNAHIRYGRLSGQKYLFGVEKLQ